VVIRGWDDGTRMTRMQAARIITDFFHVVVYVIF